MPLSVSAETTRAGPATRKRTHDQITRSQSRSQTPTVPVKRRRTETSHPLSPRLYQETSLRLPVPRFAGDGLDYRRPTVSAMAQAVEQTTIDLTLDDSTPPPPIQFGLDLDPIPGADELDRLIDHATATFAEEQLRISTTPSNRRQGQSPTEPITISDSDDEDMAPDEAPPHPSESPEVQWVGQRQVNRRLPSPNAHTLPSLAEILRRPSSQPELRRATPPELRRADAQSFRDTLRNVPGAVFDFGRNILGAMGPAQAPTATTLANFGPLPWNTRTWITRHIPTPLDPGLYDDLGDDDDDYAAIDLDYHNVGFPIDGLEIIDPGTEDAAAAAAAAMEDTYKPPPAPREGFTRDIKEDIDVLVCVACDDELATGDDEIKQQVWVAKGCGHVYCGSCASQRLAYRRGSDRDRKRTKLPKLDQLKECKAPGCDKKLTSKTSMFQVYL